MPGQRGERLLEDLPATFTAKTAREAGLSWRALYRLRDDGHVVELSRGLYRRASSGPVSWPDLLAVSARAPRGTVCLVSALQCWQLTDEMPGVVDLAVPRGTSHPAISYPRAKLHVFDPGTFSIGRARAPVGAGEHIWVSDRERTLVDCFRSRTGVGTSLGYDALRTYMSTPGARPGPLLDLARELRAFGLVHHALEL